MYFISGLVICHDCLTININCLYSLKMLNYINCVFLYGSQIFKKVLQLYTTFKRWQSISSQFSSCFHLTEVSSLSIVQTINGEGHCTKPFSLTHPQNKIKTNRHPKMNVCINAWTPSLNEIFKLEPIFASSVH